MLARVASELYWMSRYLERAESMARILEVCSSIALLTTRGESQDDLSVSEPLVITDTEDAFEASGRVLRMDQVAQFLAWDESHPSSISNCIQACRENARSVRGAITAEMWECINDTWLQLQQRRSLMLPGEGPVDSTFFEWVKERSHLFRGVTFATIQRDQPYLFIRLGTYLERADNTARILSVKTRQREQADLVADYYRLGAVLRSVSSLEAYQDIYRDAIDADRVAELLVFSDRVPRSLRFCVDEICEILDRLPSQSGRTARRLAVQLQARLRYGDLQEVYERGLYDYLERFIEYNTEVGVAVGQAYLERHG
jgi:uncharacterized alpha-E superfamily protein